jgi:hypothetical protein
MRTLSPVIPFQMSHCSSLVRLTHGMETFFYISRPNTSSQVFRVTNDVVLDTIQSTTLLLVTLYIVEVLTLSSDVV